MRTFLTGDTPVAWLTITHIVFHFIDLNISWKGESKSPPSRKPDYMNLLQ